MISRKTPLTAVIAIIRAYPSFNVSNTRFLIVSLSLTFFFIYRVEIYFATAAAYFASRRVFRVKNKRETQLRAAFVG